MQQPPFDNPTRYDDEPLPEPVRFGLFDLSRLPIDWEKVDEQALLESLLNTKIVQQRELELRRRLRTLQSGAPRPPATGKNVQRLRNEDGADPFAERPSGKASR